MTPTELGKLFLKIYPVNEEGYSQVALVEDLIKLCPDFRTKNGCDWARSDVSWLGKQFNIERIKKKGKVYSVQLRGFKEKDKIHTIPSTVKAALKGKPCVLLGTTTNTEIDHKDATYTTNNLSVEDFQVLHKSVNDAKRQHCKNCRETDIRFDAKTLCFPAAYTKGSKSLKENGCEGCFWYDIQAFIKEMTKNYVN